MFPNPLCWLMLAGHDTNSSRFFCGRSASGRTLRAQRNCVSIREEESMSVQNEQTQTPTQDRGLDRRRILFGITLAAAFTLSAGGAPVQMAQAQQPAPAQPAGRLPNVLAI